MLLYYINMQDQKLSKLSKIPLNVKVVKKTIGSVKVGTNIDKRRKAVVNLQYLTPSAGRNQ